MEQPSEEIPNSRGPLEFQLLKKMDKISDIKLSISQLKTQKENLIFELVHKPEPEFLPQKERLETAVREQEQINKVQDLRQRITRLKHDLQIQNKQMGSILEQLKKQGAKVEDFTNDQLDADS